MKGSNVLLLIIAVVLFAIGLLFYLPCQNEVGEEDDYDDE